MSDADSDENVVSVIGSHESDRFSLDDDCSVKTVILKTSLSQQSRCAYT